MSSKVILLLGTVLSALLIYLCVTTKKEEIAAALMPSQKESANPTQHLAATTPATLQNENLQKIEESTTANETPEPATTEINDTNPSKTTPTQPIAPSFAYISGEKLQVTAIVSDLDRKNRLLSHIDSYCESHPCDLQITTEKGRESAEWIDEALEIVKLFEEAKIPQSSLMIRDKEVIVDGVFNQKADFDKLSRIEERFGAKGYHVDDRSFLQEVVETVPKEEKEVQKANATEKKIAEILVGEPITFKLDSTQLSEKSKRTLRKIARMLDKESGITIEVAGYTDARGDADYNLMLSKKRAEAVKKFLLSHMKRKKQIVARGYGESGFITENPNDRRNRRVEIYLLKRGV